MKGSAPAILFAATLIACLSFGSCASQDENEQPDQKSGSIQQKYLVVDNTVTASDGIFEPLPHKAFCDRLGEMLGETDGGLQVFAIEGQGQAHFICIIADGREIIFQNKSDAPMLFSNLNLDRIEVRTDNLLERNTKVIADEATLSSIKGYISEGTPISLPELASVYARVTLISSNFRGIKLELLLIHDELGNCYIFDEESREAWSIGHELMEYIEVPPGVRR